MLGYYQTRGDGTTCWIGGYRPGCSPDERREAANARRRKHRDQENRGVRDCNHCGTEIAKSAGYICDGCRSAADERAKRREEEAERARKLRLRHGRQVVV
jgi:hypothetical protein